jgi:hypothetical protein
VTVDAPAWLRAWREAHPAAQQPGLQPHAAPSRRGGSGGRPPKAVAEALPPGHPKGNSYGLLEPDPWPEDGGVRREEVLDCDHIPPLVVRKVGWRRCLRCGKPFWSQDVVRLRLCAGQKEGCR